MAKPLSQARLNRLHKRMQAYGIEDAPLDPLPGSIQMLAISPEESAARLLALLSLSLAASNFEEADKISNWLKKEDLWQDVSENEKLFLRSPQVSDEDKAKRSFQFEGAYMLAWTLDRVPTTPDPSEECDMQLVGEFFQNIPPPGSPTGNLFEDPHYIRLIPIHDEYLFYFATQSYYKSVILADKENSSSIHQQAAFQRWLVLEWLCNPVHNSWDEVVDYGYAYLEKPDKYQ
jgi:hypothetical protein